MILFKYQGAAMFAGAQPGDTVSYEDINWTVTPQGHLEAVVPDPIEGDVVSNMIECNVASPQADAVTE